MKRFAVLVISLAVAAIPAPAAADDRSVYEAFDFGYANELKSAVDKYRRAGRGLERAPRRPRAVRRALRRVIRAVRQIDEVVELRAARISQQQSSSEAGETAKGWALRSEAAWRTGNRYELRALRAGVRGKPAVLRRWYRRSRRAHRRSRAFAERAYAAFREAGIQTQERRGTHRTRASLGFREAQAR